MTNLNKEEFLRQLQQTRQVLLSQLDDVPEADLTAGGVIGEWSLLDVLAYLTAWDGELLRRIAFASGEGRAPHPVNDDDYWQAWTEKQLKIKRIMGSRGIKTDLAGTWVRLLANLEMLHPTEYDRLLTVLPPNYLAQQETYLKDLQQWRLTWEQNQSWWWQMQQRVKRWYEEEAD